MPEVVGIRFKSCGKIYDFETNSLDIKKGDAVVVESELGLSMGHIVVEKRMLAEVSKEFKKVLRKVTEEDLKQKEENQALETEARAYCLDRISSRGLPMKLISTEATLDKKRIIFYFISDGRIDFRELVKDLAARFKTRIEMRQVGVRDEARIIGGFGLCGRELCCKTFLTTFEPISIKMAKSQELALNASKLSGVCGRLMCCLSYELNDKTKETRGKNSSAQTLAVEEEALGDIAEEQPSTEPEKVIVKRERGRADNRRAHKKPASRAALEEPVACIPVTTPEEPAVTAVPAASDETRVRRVRRRNRGRNRK